MRFLFWTIQNTKRLKEQEDFAKKMLALMTPPAAVQSSTTIDDLNKRLTLLEKQCDIGFKSAEEAVAVIDKDLADLEKAVKIIIESEGKRQKEYAK